MAGARRGARARRAIAAAVALLLIGLGTVVGGGSAAAGAEGAASASVSPSGPYAQGHPVTVSASGLEPSTLHLVTQCGESLCQPAPSPPPSVFLAPNSAVGTSTAGGTLQVSLQIERTFSIGSEPIDCTVEACRIDLIGLVDGSFVVVASTPLTFTPSGDYAWPAATLALSRTDGLIAGRSVRATGTGYDPWNGGVYFRAPATASVQICRAVTAPTPADCETPERTFDAWISGAGEVIAIGSTVNADVTVRRHLTLASGPWDCARQGCTLALDQGGNPVSQRVRIRFAPEWAPWPGPEAFMTLAVERVARRRLTADQRATLRSGLAARTTTGARALVDAATGSGHDATVGEVVRLYQAYFGRPASAGDVGYWVGRMWNGATPLAVARSFGGTAEFRAQYDGRTDAEVVARLYERTLGRSPSTAESSYWVGRLAGGLSRSDLVYSFARSPELRARMAGQTTSAIISWTLVGAVWPELAPLASAERTLAIATP